VYSRSVVIPNWARVVRSNVPDSPIKDIPASSSSFPGASPIHINAGLVAPLPSTMCERLRDSGHFVQFVDNAVFIPPPTPSLSDVCGVLLSGTETIVYALEACQVPWRVGAA
jgi:hypothetical protein